tara:strand:+ start:495 stop:1142 length:648 start_codon:yes stop_codon:yes gene_type:complete
MAYYLGSDVSVFMTTEHIQHSVSGGATAATAATGSESANVGGGNAYTSIPDRATGINAKSKVTDVIGIDFTPGTRQEEISYMGKNTNLQAEIKKEIILTLTRKVSDNTFDVLFNTPARDGVFDTGGADSTGGTATLHDGLRTTKNQNFGYRLHLRLKEDSETITIRNCCITAHTKTLDANNAQEETIEFYSYVQPVISVSGSSTQATAITAATDI